MAIEVRGKMYDVVEKDDSKDNQYYLVNDGWVEYFVNAKTDEKSFDLPEGGEVVRMELDDFCPEGERNEYPF